MILEERRGGCGEERERDIDVRETLIGLPPLRTLTGDQTLNLFGVQDGASPSQATWPGPGQGQENSVFLTLCPEPYFGDLCSSIKHIRKFKVLGVIIS